MNRNVFAVLIAIFSLLTSHLSRSSWAGDEDKGTTAAQFLKIGVGKSDAMGGAAASVIDDVTSIYWNPAGLARMTAPQIYALHSQHLDDLRYDFLAYGHPISGGRYGTAAVSFQVLTQPSIPKIDNANNDAGNFAPYSAAGSLAYAKEIHAGLSVGGAGKYVREVIDDVSAAAMAFDAGAQYRRGMISAGAAVTNLGGKLKFVSEEEDLPMSIQAGLGVRLLGDALLLAADGELPKDDDPIAHVGLEYRAKQSESGWGAKSPVWGYSIRLGFVSATVDDIDSFSGVTAGFGMEYGGMAGLDIGFAPYGDLGNSYQLGLYWRFAGKEAQTVQQRGRLDSGPGGAVRDKRPVKKTIR